MLLHPHKNLGFRVFHRSITEMGCASSKPKPKRCRHCSTPYSPVPRSFSMHIHHRPSIDGDFSIRTPPEEVEVKKFEVEEVEVKKFEVGLVEAKTWSKMIDEKIVRVAPKTPIQTPPGEPETINTWEMMEGLEDTSPLINHHVRSFSFHVFPTVIDDDDDEVLSKAVVSDFDPEIISAFRKALEELSPNNAFRLPKMSEEAEGDVGSGKERLVLYFTSLRGVRKTYEDCCDVRLILKGMGVRVDERDVSMHSGFKEELRELLGEGFGGGLPRVFVGEDYIGGAEEIRRMHEEGSLEKALGRCKFVEGERDGSLVELCEGCGDVRFVPCETCSGSCKVYYEVDEDGDEDENEDGFQRCPHCNENGLLRCPICCY